MLAPCVVDPSPIRIPAGGLRVGLSAAARLVTPAFLTVNRHARGDFYAGFTSAEVRAGGQIGLFAVGPRTGIAPGVRSIAVGRCVSGC
jgi:hypothetical protein